MVVLFAAAARAHDARGGAPAPGNAEPDVRLDAEARRGLDLLTRTRIRLPAYAGNRLNCTSCHIDGGRRPGALPWTDVARTYPQYRAREGRVVTLEDRVDQCFLRSLNGKAPPHDSPAIRDILAYFAWLSKSAPAEARTKAPGIAAQFVAGPPDARAGEVLYRSRCVRCHASDGSGLSDPDDDPYVDVPPLWGKESFNIGAGMARLHTAERFIQR
ncbi:MAG: cytochrome C, partial [Elusimicrobia bacterium]|nr:cytochrome C [Elusimicrobiota bacterium]